MNEHDRETEYQEKKDAKEAIGIAVDQLALSREDMADAEASLRRTITRGRDAGLTVAEIAKVIGKSRPWVYAFMEKV